MAEGIFPKANKPRSNLMIVVVFMIIASIGVWIGINKYKKTQISGVAGSDVFTLPAEVSLSAENQNFIRRCTKVKFKFLDQKKAPVKTTPIFISARDDKNLLTLFRSEKCDVAGLPTSKVPVPEGATEFEVFFSVVKEGSVFF